MLPNTPYEWVRPVVTVLLCLAAIALLWYGGGVLFDHDPSGDVGSLVDH